MPFHPLPEIPHRVALNRGAHTGLAELPELVATLGAKRSITVGRPFTTGTEAYVADATSLEDDSPCVLKLLIPGTDNGEGCARLLAHDTDRGAVLALAESIARAEA